MSWHFRDLKLFLLSDDVYIDVVCGELFSTDVDWVDDVSLHHNL